ncbi:MAG: hypothetical protein RSD67_04375 [Oscillospiraceae bacterium]
MALKKSDKCPFLTYRGKPLVRNGNSIYYGDPSEKFVTMLQILNTESDLGEEMAKTVSVQLISTNNELKMRDRILRRTEKNGLYPALNIASIWLERALEDEKDPSGIKAE